MQVISIISTKGGEGKSTHAANLSGFLADAGLKTLLIDGDYAQPTASSYYSLRYEAPCGLYELLMQTVDLNAPEQIISHTSVSNLDLIVSNDPHEQLKTSMMHAPDGRIRLRNLLQHPLFNAYDVVVIDSQGARSIMLELVLLATNHTALAMIKPVVPDVREFLRGTIPLLEGLLPYRGFGIVLPPVKVLVNCMDYTTLAKTRWRRSVTSLPKDLIAAQIFPLACSIPIFTIWTSTKPGTVWGSLLIALNTTPIARACLPHARCMI